MTNKTTADILLKAQNFEDDDKFEQAYECYKNAHEANKNDADVIQKLAVTAQTLQKNEDALYYWNLFMYIKPQDPISYTQLLDLYFHDNKYEYYLTRAKLKTIENRLPQATDDYKKAINNTTDSKLITEARHMLAQTYEIINKPLQAIDEYLKILDFEHNEGVYLSLANLYFGEDKSATLNLLNKAIAQYPESEEIKALICKTYLALGDYQNAKNYAGNNFDKIKACLMQQDNDTAFEIIKNLSDKEKKDSRYPALIAEYYYNIDDNENALKYIDIFEKTEPQSPLPNQMRALVYEKIDNDFEAHLNWGKYYIKKQNTELALDEYLSAHNLNPQNTEVIKELINLYSIIEDKFACVEFCEKLIVIEKDDTAMLKRIINFYEEQGYEKKVLEYLGQLIKTNQRDHEALLKLAKHAQKNRKIDSAIDYYENYLKFAPNSDEKEDAKVQLNMLTTGEIGEEEGFLEKLLRFFSKK